MAASEVILLSSSPHRPTAPRASSPSLPSPSYLLGGAKRRGYSTEALDLAEVDTVARKPATVRRASEKRKYSSVGEGDTPSEVGALKLSRKTEHKFLKDAISAEDGHEIPKGIMQDAIKPKRSRAKQDGIQTKITKARVTKPILANQEKPVGTGSRKAKRKSIPSDHDRHAKAASQGEDHALSASEDLCLEKALRRKSSWTPPIDTIAVLDLTETVETTQGKMVGQQMKERDREFEDICRAFGFDGKVRDIAGNKSFTASVPANLSETQSTNSRAESRDIPRAFGFNGMGKDLDTAKSCSAPKSKTSTTLRCNKATSKSAKSTGIASDANEQPKPNAKMPKKKAKTITEQATAPYAPDRPQSLKAPLLHYFSPENRVDSTSHRHPESGAEAACPPAKAGTMQRVTKPKAKSKKNDPQAQPGLLSPRSANKKIEDQEFLFGTSSQLAREEPPTLNRDIQSLASTSRVFGVSSGSDGLELTSLPNTGSCDDKLLNFRSSRSLWSVAAGDRIELIAPEPPDNSGEHAQETVVANVSDVIQSSQEEGESRGKANRQLAKPDFESYPTTQLASELASYGFKPTKSRKRMITLLEKCWEGKHRIALKALEANTHVPPLNNAAPPSSSHGMECWKSGNTERPQHGSAPQQRDQTNTMAPRRPRKGAKQVAPIDVGSTNHKESSTHTKGDLYTVPESPVHVNMPTTTDLIRSSSLLPSRSGQGPRSPTQSTISATSPALLDDAAASQTRRFFCISKAIRSEPPSRKSGSPTWHERILMYDPIVLEDLTVWLNTKGLGVIGEDFEVGPAEVKTWCLQNSICCLWRENLWGNGRTRR